MGQIPSVVPYKILTIETEKIGKSQTLIDIFTHISDVPQKINEKHFCREQNTVVQFLTNISPFL